ncbi:MAG TPA: MFS transporter [Rhabdochlamydiaceae bacterium]|nr:MFS transporter [Rhabdochlamydiaceae bacterium]
MFPSKIRPLLPYAIVVFLGYVGFSLPLPVLPEIFLDAKRSILPPSMSIQFKTVLLGIVLAAYPSGQLLGSPLLGVLSDKWGRKRVILYSLASTAVGYAITALAMGAHSVIGIFGGLFLCGFSEGNVTIAQAVIGDIAGKGEKVAHFGWINFFSCTAFIVGPLLGGWLADPNNNRLFTFATPFWLGSLMSVAAIFIIWKFSMETKKHGDHGQGFLQGMKSNWDNPYLQKFYIAIFFLYFGLYAFWNCLGIYLQRRFDFSTTGLAYVMAYDSFFFAVGLLFLVQFLAKKMKPFTTTGWASFGFALMLVILVLPKSPWGLVATVAPIGILISILMTNAAVMVSDAADDRMQGQALGTMQAIQVLAGMCVGIIGGLLAAVRPELPLVAGGLMAAVCGFLLIRRRKHV